MNFLRTSFIQSEDAELELEEEREATVLWKESVLSNENPKDDDKPFGYSVEVLSQYECDQCEEEHYHTKRAVRYESL